MPRARRSNPPSLSSPERHDSARDSSPPWWQRWRRARRPSPDAPTEHFTRWPWWRRWFGHRCERAVAAHLRRLGFTLLAANLRLSPGEIDLLALDGKTLVVVEVRSTQSSRPEALQEVIASVDARKQQKLTHAALAFLQRYRALGQVPVRFDIVAVAWPPHARYPLIHHIPNAFEAQGRFQFFS